MVHGCHGLIGLSLYVAENKRFTNNPFSEPTSYNFSAGDNNGSIALTKNPVF
jgi:hypothetical protein